MSLTNHDIHLIYCREYYQKNKETISKRHKKYRDAHKEYYSNYYKSKKGKAALNKYRQSEKGKKTIKQYQQSKEHRENSRQRQIKYRKTEKGKLNGIKVKAKRKRNLGFTPLFDNPFADSELIDWHHMDDKNTVAIPRDMHELYCGRNIEEHRYLIMTIINQIYLE